ncbi:hypothetical protein ACIHFC_32435 [Streptomyces sp. NPDC052013]|uniref:hypothetical protein n=1 Tax=unclassified Streptomyces TaxID=2593676 RepID=UPI00344D165A
MSEQTPSQAEGERQQETTADDAARTAERHEMPRTTPSQSEGEDTGDEDTEESEARESGWSGP